MKIKALLAAALVASSSTAFAKIDNGAEYSTTTGGELVLAMWDDVAKKSILFDTGLTFVDMVNRNDAKTKTTIDLTAIDATYKSFFNNDFSNVYWNAFSGSKWSNGEQFDSSKYFGVAFSAKDPAFELANPRDFGTVTGIVEGAYSDLITANTNFSGDTTGVSANLSYRSANSADPKYLGNLGILWTDQIKGNYPLGTSAKAGQELGFVWNTTNFDTAEGSMINLGSIKFDPTASTLSITPNPISTPLPAAAWLLMSGIAGFGAIARRRKQQA
ncbi:MAG: VPLPA-CTERM sorting domain-containing protein [Marinagarivorans sp.]